MSTRKSLAAKRTPIRFGNTCQWTADASIPNKTSLARSHCIARTTGGCERGPGTALIRRSRSKAGCGSLTRSAHTRALVTLRQQISKRSHCNQTPRLPFSDYPWDEKARRSVPSNFATLKRTASHSFRESIGRRSISFPTPRFGEVSESAAPHLGDGEPFGKGC